MKKIKIFILLLSIFIVVCVVCNTAIYKKYQQEVEQLNFCYEYITETIEYGFDKKQASNMKLLFKEVLKNGISENAFRKSEFYNSNISFSKASPWICPEDRSDLNVAHCRDLILAMYLSSVLATEPENLINEFEWLKDGIWQIDPKPEFMHLIATKYNPTKEDIDVLVNAVQEFSKTLEHPLDEYHTRAFVYTFVNDYNEIHKSNEYVLKNEETFIKENIEISKKIDKEDFATIWVGYGKVIRLKDQSGDGSRPIREDQSGDGSMIEP